ncbi:MAG: hypothetical protein IPP42_05565 [Saprospiraceae bacterium]|nr:hypothetical protein [Saprospiraceae bacterium]
MTSHLGFYHAGIYSTGWKSMIKNGVWQISVNSSHLPVGLKQIGGCELFVERFEKCATRSWIYLRITSVRNYIAETIH